MYLAGDLAGISGKESDRKELLLVDTPEIMSVRVSVALITSFFLFCLDFIHERSLRISIRSYFLLCIHVSHVS